MAKPFEKELIASTHHLPTPEGLQSGLPTAGRSGKKRSKMEWEQRQRHLRGARPNASQMWQGWVLYWGPQGITWCITEETVLELSVPTVGRISRGKDTKFHLPCLEIFPRGLSFGLTYYLIGFIFGLAWFVFVFVFFKLMRLKKTGIQGMYIMMGKNQRWTW